MNIPGKFLSLIVPFQSIKYYLYNKYMVHVPSTATDSQWPGQKNSLYFMEPEHSLPRSSILCQVQTRANSTQSTTSHTISWRPILILSFPLREK